MTQTQAQAVAAFTKAAVAVVQGLDAELAKAPEAVDPALAAKAAQALVDGGWVIEAKKEAAAAALADQATALETLCNLARKAAQGDPRLAGGEPVASETKLASNGQPLESEADRLWAERTGRYRRTA